MGAQNTSYCDGCGDELPTVNLMEAVTLTALGTNGLPTQIFLCVKPEVIPADEDSTEMIMPKITGCARKVLSPSILARLYQDVRDYTGDEKAKPFQL